MKTNVQFKRLESAPRTSSLQSIITIIEQQEMHHCVHHQLVCIVLCWCWRCTAHHCAASSTFVFRYLAVSTPLVHRMLLHFGPFCCRRPFNVGTRRCSSTNCRFILSAQFPHITLQTSTHKKWIMDPISGDYFGKRDIQALRGCAGRGSKGQKIRLKSVDGSGP